MSLVGLLIHILGLMALIGISVGSIERLTISPRAMTIAKGMPYGFAACAAMITPVILDDGTVLNGRSLFLAFSAAFGGIGSFVTATLIAGIGLNQLTNVGIADTIKPTLLAGVIGLFWHYFVYPRHGMRLLSLIALGTMVSGLALLLLVMPSGQGAAHFLRACPAALVGSLAAALILGRFVERERRHFRREVEWRNEAHIDVLTSLGNKRAFFAASALLVERASAYTIFAIDVDHFKRVNDTYGHEAGDIVLQKLASTIVSVLPAGAQPYRLGGEEFVVVLEGKEIEAGLALAESLRKAVEATVIDMGRSNIQITVSIGVADSSQALEPAHVLSEADKALYRAKEAGRNRIIASAGSAEGALSWERELPILKVAG